ncbi:MAG: TOMM precursor leader peptide-binding protein [Actinomycetes bacterium]
MAVGTPAFLAKYDVRPVPGAGVFLLSEGLPVTLSGRLFELVCPLVDGVRTADQIAAELRDVVPGAEVYYALNLLSRGGHIQEASAAMPTAQAAFWQSCGVDPAAAHARLAAHPVKVAPFGQVDAGGMIRALQGSGIRCADSADNADIVAAVTDDYRDPDLLEFAEQARQSGTRWVAVRPVGLSGWLGPAFDAEPVTQDSARGTGGEPCWLCLVNRVRLNNVTDAFVEAQTGAHPVTGISALPATVAVVENLVSVAVARWIVSGRSELTTCLQTVSFQDLSIERHELPNDPLCPWCGDHDLFTQIGRDPEPVVLGPTPYVVTDSGHRGTTAGGTLQQYSHLVSPVTGVVSDLRRISDRDHSLIHAYAASHNWATSPDSLDFVRRSLRSHSGGKGTTDDAAKVGALAEAIERYSGVFRGDERRRRATLADLAEAGCAPVSPNQIQLFSDAQFDRRDEINGRGDPFQTVPERFDTEAAMDWSPAWAPTRQRFRWVPTGLVYYSYANSMPDDTPNRFAARADSNGCAAGSTLAEAALQALLELAERDAVATWWYNEVRRPQVDLDGADSDYLGQLREWLDGEGRDLWVLDITNDVGIPSYAAVSSLREPLADGSEQVVVGFGAHLSPQIGVLRAVTEVNQFFAGLFALGDLDLSVGFERGAVQWWRSATRTNKPFLLPAVGDIRPISGRADLAGEDLAQEVETVVGKIEARGPEVLLLDQTRPEVGMPVVKALAPGLRHFWARLAPGRLYDVPVELGWLDRPREESDLNPTPVFF